MGFLEKYNKLFNEQDETEDQTTSPTGEQSENRMSDEELMDAIINLLISLDEDKLDNDQVDMLFNIMNELDIQANEPDDEEEEEVSEIRLLKKTPMAARRKGRMYYKKHKSQIKRKLKKTKKKREMLAARGRGMSGKKLGMTKRR